MSQDGVVANEWPEARITTINTLSSAETVAPLMAGPFLRIMTASSRNQSPRQFEVE